jgi:hypothetical protein
MWLVEIDSLAASFMFIYCFVSTLSIQINIDLSVEWHFYWIHFMFFYLNWLWGNKTPVSKFFCPITTSSTCDNPPARQGLGATPIITLSLRESETHRRLKISGLSDIVTIPGLFSEHHRNNLRHSIPHFLLPVFVTVSPMLESYVIFRNIIS